MFKKSTNFYSPGSFLYVCPGGNLSLRQSAAICEVGAFEDERGVVIIASKSAVERYDMTIGMKAEEVWSHLTSLARHDVTTSETDHNHILLIKSKLVPDICSQVPQATLDKIKGLGVKG